MGCNLKKAKITIEIDSDLIKVRAQLEDDPINLNICTLQEIDGEYKIIEMNRWVTILTVGTMLRSVGTMMAGKY